MIKSENKLSRLLEIIRKDTGINNAIDAVEQLSLVLFLKYFQDCLLGDALELKNPVIFNDFFYNSGNFQENEINFYALNSLLENVTREIDAHFPGVYLDDLTRDSVRKAESILRQIPFRIRSEKVLKVLLLRLEEINFAQIKADDYDALITDMVNESSYSGAFYTPDALVRAVSKVMDPVFGETVYDPALGTGGFIVEVKKRASIGANGNPINSSYVYGKDTSPFACLVSSLKLLLNGFNINCVALGDSLLEVDHSTYDLILTAPPFGKISNISNYQCEFDSYAPSLELMFLKLSMRKLNSGGRAAIIVPEGILFGGSNQHLKIKRDLLTNFNLHTVLSLPSSTLSPYTNIKISVLFFDNCENTDNIWFYELASEKPFSKVRPISDLDLADFVNSFDSRPEGANSYLVSKQEILETEDLNLSFKPPHQIGDGSKFNISDNAALLRAENEDFGVLLSNFTGLLAKDKKAKFVEKVTIGDIFKTRTGQKLNISEFKEMGQIPVYGANGIIGYCNDSNRNGENILIGRVGAHCGNVYYTNGPIWVTDNSFSIELTSPRKVHLPYLASVLISLDLNKFARGSAQPSISFSKIKDTKVSLPTYEDQVALAKWFEDIRNLESELHASLRLQGRILSQLSDFSVLGNCVAN